MRTMIENEAGTPITAGEIRVGDTVQHYLKRWEAARVLTITPNPYVAGVSRYALVYPSGRTATLAGVPNDARFLRYATA